MSWFSSLFGGSSGGGGNIFSDIFRSALGGVSASSASKNEVKQLKEAAKAQGQEARKTAAFTSDLDYYYGQKLRHEKRRALDTNYNQFSTVKNYAPFFKPGAGLDPLSDKPDPEDYNG